MASETLLSTLRARRLPFDASSIEGALSDDQHGPAFAEWVRLRLTPDTLLSADEHELFSALEKSGKANSLAASLDDESVAPLSDEDLRIAIEELNRSTDAISKQTEMLKQQQDALARLVKLNGKGSDARANLEASHARQAESRQKQLAAKVEELSQSVSFRISDLELQGRTSGTGLHQTVDSLLHADDKLLDSLQKLGRELKSEDPEEKEDIAGLKETCARLIKCKVETVRTRLDRLYLETLETAQGSREKNNTSADDVANLQEEVESLYSELLPVAQMSVEEQHLKPALKSLDGQNGQSLDRSREAVHYIDSCLDFVLDRIDSLSARIETFKSHQAATATLIATARSELAVQVPTAKKERRPTFTGSPNRRRKSSGATPLRTRSGTGPRRRSSGGLPDLPPLENLMQILGLNVPLDDAAADGQENITALAAALAERTAKVDDTALNVQESFEQAAALHLLDAGKALRMIHESVLAESPYEDVKLADPGIEASVEVLEQEVAKVQGRLDGVEEARRKADKSAVRDEFVKRWGR